MNAPDRTKLAPAPTRGQMERAAELRELIHLQAYFIGIYAGIVQDFACAGDDGGLSYGLEKLALYTKTALSLRVDLDAVKREIIGAA